MSTWSVTGWTISRNSRPNVFVFLKILKRGRLIPIWNNKSKTIKKCFPLSLSLKNLQSKKDIGKPLSISLEMIFLTHRKRASWWIIYWRLESLKIKKKLKTCATLLINRSRLRNVSVSFHLIGITLSLSSFLIKEKMYSVSLVVIKSMKFLRSLKKISFCCQLLLLIDMLDLSRRRLLLDRVNLLPSIPLLIFGCKYKVVGNL
jgi:hypothetical protein